MATNIGTPTQKIETVYTKRVVADTVEANNVVGYLPLSGGTMTGDTIGRNVDNGYMAINSSSSAAKGGFLRVYGKDHPSSPGQFQLFARDGDEAHTRILVGQPNGDLVWATYARNIPVKSMAFPSSTRITMTYDNNQVVAPANGYVSFWFNVTNKTQPAFIRIINDETKLHISQGVPPNSVETTTAIYLFVPAKKNDVCKADLLVNSSVNTVFFIYADGEV